MPTASSHTRDGQSSSQGLSSFLLQQDASGARVWRDEDIRKLLPLALLALPPALVGEEGKRLLRELARTLGLETAESTAQIRAALSRYVKAHPPPPRLRREFRAYLVCHLRGFGLARELSAIAQKLLPRPLRALQS